MTRPSSQARAVERVRAMIIRAAFLDLETRGALGQPLPLKPEAVAASAYEFCEWREDAGLSGGLFVYAQVRRKDPKTLGYLFPRAYHVWIGPRGAIRELGGKRAGGRMVGLGDYLRGR